MNKAIMMGWAGHAARMKKEEFIYDIGGKARREVTTRKALTQVGG
jgi:hypothetical protein